MKIDFRTLWKKILNPPTWAKVLTFIITLLSATLSLVMVALGLENGALAIIAYILFGVAGVSLTYSVYLIIPLFPKMKSGIIAWMEKYEFTHLLLRNFGFRTVIFAIGSFLMSLLFSGFNAYMGIKNRSIWYGALAAFYIALAFLRGGVLAYHKSRIGKKTQNDEYVKAKVYRNSGIITLILNIALSSAIAQMIFSDAHFTYMGWTIFAYAAYAFYKITMSIIALIRAHKQTDLTVRAIRNINLVDALVSILALQTALLTMFSEGEINISIFNTFTGIVVSLLSVGIGIYMIVSANKKMKEIQKENKTNEQSI
jgi:MFS family permease